MKTQESTIEPYRLLFPIGLYGGCVGAGLWFLLAQRWIAFYPRSSHAHLMYFSFIWSFVAGFLMTAIPKMSKTNPANIIELFLACFFGLLQIGLSLRNQSDASVWLFALQSLFLLAFICRRLIKVRQLPFAGFVFVPVAFVQTLLGFAIYIVWPENREVYLLLAGEAFIMNLILGLGSRLIPVISRLPNAISPELQTRSSFLWPGLICLGLNFGYALRALGVANLGAAVSAGAALLAAVQFLGLVRKPAQWSVIAVGIKLGLSFIISGLALSAPQFGIPLAALHLVYIGGFVLLTLLISTRVVLAHGEQSLTYEIHSTQLGALILALSLAAVLRTFSTSQPTSPVVLVALGLFLLAAGLWFLKFIQVSQGSKSA